MRAPRKLQIITNRIKLQLVQNFAAHVLTDTKKFDHISPVLWELG